MAKQHYYFKLIPPRATFPADITKEERDLMDKHKAYCQQQFEQGNLLVYGPVMAPEGAFGLAILEVADEAEARQFGENDPSISAGMNRFSICPI
ncbi:MAG: YciI family protein [Candidatus Korobacteraceae bacterium]